MPANQKTDRYLSTLAGLGIVLVVLGHSLGVPEAKGEQIAAVDPLYRAWRGVVDWITTFHMPLFFLISGVTYWRFTRAKGRPMPQVLRDRAVRLLVPYLVISTLTYPIKAQLGGLAQRPAELSLSGWAESLVYPWQNPIIFFWFLPTLFLVFCLLPVLEWLSRSRVGTIFVLVLLIVAHLLTRHRNDTSLLNWPGVLHHSIHFFAGVLLEREGVMQRLRGWAVLGIVPSVMLYLVVRDGGPFEPLPVGSAPSGMTLAGPFLGLVCAFCGIAFAIGLARLIHAATPLLASIGDDSFQIYLFSWYPQTATRVVLGQKLFVSVWLAVGTSFALGLLVPILLTWILDRICPAVLAPVYGRAVRRGTPPLAFGIGSGGRDYRLRWPRDPQSPDAA